MSIPCKVASGALCHSEPNIKETSPEHTKNFKTVHQLCPLPGFYFGSTSCLIQIACFCFTDHGKVSQAIGTCRMQCASLLISYLISYSHLLPVRVSTTGLQFPLFASACPPGSSGKVARLHTHRHTCTRQYTLTRTGT